MSGFVARFLGWLATGADRLVGWHRLPGPLALMVLAGIRLRLRTENLVHTSLGLPPAAGHPPPAAGRRAPDGTHNDLRYPSMGAAGTPFGRNVPRTAIRLDVDAAEGPPTPRAVSNAVLKRETFEEAGKLNLLAAAWVQFMLHDWVSHGPTRPPGPAGALAISLDDAHPDDRRWRERHGAMSVAPTASDPRGPRAPPDWSPPSSTP